MLFFVSGGAVRAFKCATIVVFDECWNLSLQSTIGKTLKLYVFIFIETFAHKDE